MFTRLIAAGILSVMLAAPASAQEKRTVSFKGQQDKEAMYKGKYGPAEDALRCAFPGASVAASWREVKVVWTPTIHPAVQHLAEVDGPKQGGGGQFQDWQKLCAYLKSTNHPTGGNVTAWYKANFPDLAKR